MNEKIGHRTKVHNLYFSLCIAFTSLTYFFMLPSSISPYLFFIFLFFLLCLRFSKESVAFFMLFFGNLFLGHLFLSMGIKYVGFAVAVLTGVFLIFITTNVYTKRSQTFSFNWYLPGVWLLFTSCVLIISYGLGPQSSYSMEKLLLYHRRLVLSIIALAFLMSNKDCDYYGRNNQN